MPKKENDNLIYFIIQVSHNFLDKQFFENGSTNNNQTWRTWLAQNCTSCGEIFSIIIHFLTRDINIENESGTPAILLRFWKAPFKTNLPIPYFDCKNMKILEVKQT